MKLNISRPQMTCRIDVPKIRTELYDIANNALRY